MPDIGTVCGLAPPASMAVMFAVSAPFRVGSKTTTTVQLAPAAIDPGESGQVELDWMTKLATRDPVTEILLVVTAVVPTLVMVTVCGELAVLTD